MISRVVLTTVFLGSTTVLAGPLLECEQMPKGDVAKCNERVKAECPERKKDTYWPSKECEDKIAKEMNQCFSPAVEKACKEASSGHYKYCSAFAATFDANKPDEVAAFVDKAKAFPGFVERWKKDYAEWGACYTKSASHLAPVSSPACGNISDGESANKACEAAAEKFQESWLNYVNFVIESVSCEEPEETEPNDESPYGNMLSSCEEAIEKIETAAKINESLGDQGVDMTEILTWVVQAKVSAKKIETLRNKRIASRRCPTKDDAPNAKLKPTLQKAAVEYFTSVSTENLKEKVKGFVLRGKLEKSTDQSTWDTYESVPATVCVHGTEADKSTNCRVFYVIMQRVKPWRAAGFNDWTVGTIGTVDQMLCENLK